MTASSSDVSEVATQARAAAQQALGAAADLSREAEHLSAAVNSFMAQVRVA